MNHRHAYGNSGPSLPAAVALALSLSVGCSGEGASSGDANIASSYDNLTTDLSICAKSRETCLDAADGDRPKIQTCQDELADCRDAVQAARKEVHAGIRACVDAAKECVHSIGDGGEPAARQCGQTFHACVKAALPPPPPLPPCVQPLKDCLAANADGGRDAKQACLEQFRSCAVGRLPPCMHGLAECVDGGGDVRECTMQARQCKDYRLSHDGGVPPGQ